MSLDAQIHRRVVEAAPEGVVLVDATKPDHPVVYVNGAFERLTGYSAAELVGRNLRILQGEDRDQDARQRLREAIKREEPCRVLMRNYRKGGAPFWNEIAITPLFDAEGKISHYAGYHRDAGDRLRNKPAPAAPAAREAKPQAAPPVQREDRLTGLSTLSYLEELLNRDWAVAQRERSGMAAFCIDIDALDLYNTTFGRAAGDSAIRRVGHCIAGCLRRSSDVIARVDGGNLVAYAPGVPGEQAMRIGQTMAERVRELRIHHPRSGILRYVSVSVGVAATVPQADDESATLLDKARQRLAVAKETGRNRAA